jgi:Protein of unknown function (DUF1552)
VSSHRRNAYLSRRAVLAAASGLLATGLLPRSIWAESPPPKRLVIFFSPCGTRYNDWLPRAGASGLELGPILKPFEAIKSKVAVVDGIVGGVLEGGRGDQHMRGIGGILTGRELLNGTVQGGGGLPAGLGSGISIDQAIAEQIGGGTRFPSLELAAAASPASVWSRMSYRGSNNPVPPSEDPVETYKRVFARSDLSPKALAILQKRRKSVLDQSAESLRSLSAKLSGRDRESIDAHVTAIRESERRLLAEGAVCGALVPELRDVTNAENFPYVVRSQIDMLVNALACGQTNIVTMQMSQASSQMVFPSLGINSAHHDLSHAGDTDSDAQGKLVKINNWYASQIAYCLSKLDATKEGAGTLLDNTLVVWVNELSKGNVHTHRPLPVLLAGGAAGSIKMGRLYSLRDRQLNDFLITIANVMGVPMTSFGDPRFSTGAIRELLA